MEATYIRQTPNGKNVEVCNNNFGLWFINPHAVNIPTKLKGVFFTNPTLALKEVDAWIETIKEKEEVKIKKKK